MFTVAVDLMMRGYTVCAWALLLTPFIVYAMIGEEQGDAK